MRRNVVVGVLAGSLGLLLIGLWTYIELRHSELGVFMRNSAVNGRPTSSFDESMSLMRRWVRIHQFVMSPIASILVGLFVGFLCRNRIWLALLIGVVPIVLMNSPSDVLSAIAAAICFLVAWIGAKSGQAVVTHFRTSRAAIATTT